MMNEYVEKKQKNDKDIKMKENKKDDENQKNGADKQKQFGYVNNRL